jgi:hypothetical protein
MQAENANVEEDVGMEMQIEKPITVPEPILQEPSLISSKSLSRGRSIDNAENRQSITFADEQGDLLAENHFVQNLHYSVDVNHRLNNLNTCCIMS